MEKLRVKIQYMNASLEIIVFQKMGRELLFLQTPRKWFRTKGQSFRAEKLYWKTGKMDGKRLPSNVHYNKASLQRERVL